MSRNLPLLLVAAATFIVGGYRFVWTDDRDASVVVGVGVLLIGAWLALEVQRLSDQRKSHGWPDDERDDEGTAP